MPRISRESLMSLESYARERAAFRARVMAHKKNRTLHLGPNVTVVFEDELTIRYQIQEMLRVERIFEEEGIMGELEAYNPLVPDGTNWKATLMVEYPDPAERRTMLAKLIGVEDRVWVQVRGCPRIHAIADEDLDRETAEKTSSVHFLRFEIDPASVDALKRGALLAVGVDHPQYSAAVDPVQAAVTASLVADLA